MDSQYSDLADQYAEKGASYYEMERSEMLPFVPVDINLVLMSGANSTGSEN